jgi:hypothetical protein
MWRQRVVLSALLIWALLMIVPDLLQVARPLGSFGFSANSDGLIYDVADPFLDRTASPAWKAGIKEGDRVDLSRMRCIPYSAEICRSTLSALILQYAMPGSSATLDVISEDGQSRQVVLVAEKEPTNWLIRAVAVLDQIVGVLVVVGTAWLVWTRPSRMSWGFFLYSIWFNPGQGYWFYAFLARWPQLLLAQIAAGCIAQAAGYAGLLLFALRVPANQPDPQLRPLERALPAVAVVLTLAVMATYGSLFGHQSEVATRTVILASGAFVNLCAIAILMVRRKRLTPVDYQRIRWVIWGCLIGLPAYTIAQLAQDTDFFGAYTPADDVIGVLYLINGVLWLFVLEAIRRPRVVSVIHPLRRVTLLAFILSVPALLLHHEVDRIQGYLDLPTWAWLCLGTFALFLITRVHEGAVELTDRYFNRAIERAGVELGNAILTARTLADIDRLLATRTLDALKLASAAVFRRIEGNFVRDEGAVGWDESKTHILRPDEPMLAPVSRGAVFNLGYNDESEFEFPSGLNKPILGVPVANPRRCFAVALYGPHRSGTDLDAYERALLARLATNAAAAYAELEIERLQSTRDHWRPNSLS